jgi:hypothetical protein
MATYYIGADVHSNNTELAVEQRGKIVSRYSVPTTIPAISTVLDSFLGRKIFAMEEGPCPACRSIFISTCYIVTYLHFRQKSRLSKSGNH